MRGERRREQMKRCQRARRRPWEFHYATGLDREGSPGDFLRRSYSFLSLRKLWASIDFGDGGRGGEALLRGREKERESKSKRRAAVGVSN